MLDAAWTPLLVVCCCLLFEECEESKIEADLFGITFKGGKNNHFSELWCYFYIPTQSKFIFVFITLF
jgi:hypothetical protein